MAQGVGGTKKRGPKGPSKYTEDVLNKWADELIEFMSSPENFWFKDFAILKGVHSSELRNLSENHEKLSKALKKAHEIQESKIAKMAMNGTFNASMSIFALKNVAGWRDTQDITHKGDENSPIVHKHVVSVDAGQDPYKKNKEDEPRD